MRLDARGDRQREHGDDDAVRAKHHADIALLESGVGAPERRREDEHSHAEREDERDAGEEHEARIEESRERIAHDARFGRRLFHRQGAAQRRGIEKRDQDVTRGAAGSEEAVPLLGDETRGYDAQGVSDAHAGVIQGKDRLAPVGRREVEEQRARHRHVDGAGGAERDAPYKERGGAVDQEEARQDHRRAERREEQQHAAADAIGERAEHRREQAARQALAQEAEPDQRDVEADAMREVDAEELDQAHARGDREEIRAHHDRDAPVEV